MKTPYYNGSFTVAQHTDTQDDLQLRERMLEHRLLNREDKREIFLVTALPFSGGLEDSSLVPFLPFSDKLKNSHLTRNLAKWASKASPTDMSWGMHWAIRVGGQFFELQRGYPDPLRTGLRMSSWDEEKMGKIHQSYSQGFTTMSDQDIRAAGEQYFSRLERIDINTYDIWCNNCQLAVDKMLRDIGGLSYYRSRLKSLHEWVRQFFYDSVLAIVGLYGSFRGWNEDIVIKYSKTLHNTLRLMTARSKYPKRHWIRNDIDMAEGVMKKANKVGDHWVLTVLESALSLRKSSDDLYVHRGADGKPQLNFEALRKATKGIFDEDVKSMRVAWLKAAPWLTAGFLVGTTKWAAAVISIALSHASQVYEDRVRQSHMRTKGGLQNSLTGMGFSPDPQNIPSPASKRPKLNNQRRPTGGQKRVSSRSSSMDSNLLPRYEICHSTAGVLYFFDRINKTRTWDAPDYQEMCLKITNPALSRRWEEKEEDGRKVYVNRISGARTDVRPGPSEIWAVKKRVRPGWLKSTTMALPHGWEMCRTEEGEMYYLDHKIDPPISTTIHPMRLEIEHERKALLPRWNVEYENDRGKKYRNIESGEIRWKAVDGPRAVTGDPRRKSSLDKPKEKFVEPLPAGWTVTTEEDGQKIYRNGKSGKERIERWTHPQDDKRRRIQPEWEMRYTAAKKRYWVHHGSDGQGSTWWKRNKIPKAPSLKNNASGWKLAENGLDWEWFEGGDVPHSDDPVLDLDDPAEMEFREYPFILPPILSDEKGNFIEPLPRNWVRRSQGHGKVYYWNFKDPVQSDEHPNEEERRNLPALWEMRFTRHGRKYFLDHGDGSTWWTNPRQPDQERIQRALVGQGQDGWKFGEDGKTWERFEEYPNAQQTEQKMEALTLASESSPDPSIAERSRSSSSTRSWLRNIGADDIVADAIASAKSRVPKTPKLLKRFSDKKSPSSNSEVVTSPQPIEGDSDLAAGQPWLSDTPEMMTAEPEEETTQLTPSQLKDLEESMKSIEEQVDQFEKMEGSRSIPTSLKDSPLDTVKEEDLNHEAAIDPSNSHEVSNRQESQPAILGPIKRKPVPSTTPPPSLPSPSPVLSPSSPPPCPSPSPSTSSTPHLKPTKKAAWAQRTTSGLMAMKKNIESRVGENGIRLPNGRVVLRGEGKVVEDGEGLGITGLEGGEIVGEGGGGGEERRGGVKGSEGLV